MARIDIVIPAYNAQRTLHATITSLLQQQTPPAKIVVVNDGSTDETPQIAQSFGTAIRLITTPNGGQGRARFIGESHCSAEFVLFIDADDQLKPPALRQLSAALDLHSDSVAAYCRAELRFDTGAAPPEFVDRPLHDADGDVWSELIADNFIRTPGCVLMRRAALEAVGGWDPNWRYAGHEDYDLWLRLAARGNFIRVAEPLLLYHVHPASFSFDRRKMTRSWPWVFYKQAHLVRNDPQKRPIAWRRYRQARGSLLRALAHSMKHDTLQGRPRRAVHSLLLALRIAVETSTPRR